MFSAFSPSPAGPNTFTAGPAAHPHVGQPVQQPETDGLRNALLRLRPMQHIMTLLPKLVKGMHEDDVFNYAYQNLEHIGNKYYAQYLLLAEPDANYQVAVPTHCMSLDFIAPAEPCGFRVGASATSLDELLWMGSQPLRAALAPATASADPVPAEGGEQAGWQQVRPGQSWLGSFAAWEQLQPAWGQRLACALVPTTLGARVQLPPGTGLVVMSYKARLELDGAPLLTHLEALSSAYYCEYCVAHDKFMMKELTGDHVKLAKDRYEESLTPARNEGLGDKDGLALLLNTLTSFHRHFYGSPVQLNQW